MKPALISAVVATLITAPTPSPGQSEDKVSPEDLWSQFLTTCSKLLTDPDGYLSGLPSPGAAGERVVSISPDENAVTAFHRTGNAYDEVELLTIGDRQVRACNVIGEYYDMETDVLAERFVAFAASQEGISITGGHVPQDYRDQAENGFYTVDDYYLYAVDGLWSETGEVTTVAAIGGELQFLVEFVVEITE